MAPAAVAEQAARVAHVHVEGVAADHEPLDEEHAGPVGDEAVALHLAQPQPSLPAPSLGGLPGEDGAGAAGPAVHLVEDHVLELLVVDGAHVDVGLHALARYAGGERVLALGDVAYQRQRWALRLYPFPPKLCASAFSSHKIQLSLVGNRRKCPQPLMQEATTFYQS